MSTLTECQLASLAAQGYTTGTINERTWAWLADQTGASGTLNELWVALLTGFGYSGTLNEMQIASWVNLGAPSSQWNEAAYWFWCVNGGQYGPTPPTGPDFLALAANDDGEWLGVVEGIGAAVSTSTSSRYYPDFEGIYREALAGEIGCVGGRVVRNLLTYSEDFSNAIWVANLCTKTPSGDECVLDSTGTFWTIYQGFVGDYRNNLFVSTIDLKVVNANGGYVRVNLPDSGSSILVTDKTDWTRVSVAGAGGEYFARLTISGEVSGQEVHVRYPQFEDVTGQTNQNPAEYVPTTDSSAVKYFDYANANTVTDSVVTESKGAPFAVKPRARVVGYELVNSALRSNDATNVAWVKTDMTAALDEVGLTGEPSAASTLTATGANATCLQTVTAASGDYASRFFLKRKTGTGTVEITVDGTTWTPVTLTSDYEEFSVDGTAIANPQVGVRITTSGDEVILGNGECFL